MSYREKEWDEPGPDFGKVYRLPARRITSTQLDPKTATAEEIRDKIASIDANNEWVSRKPNRFTQNHIDMNNRTRARLVAALVERFGEEA